MDQDISEALAGLMQSAIKTHPGLSRDNFTSSGTVSDYSSGDAILPTIENPMRFDTGGEYGRIAAATLLIQPADESTVITTDAAFTLTLYGAHDPGVIFSDWADGAGVTVNAAQALTLRGLEIATISFSEEDWDDHAGADYCARQRVALDTPAMYDLSDNLKSRDTVFGILRSAAAWAPGEIAQNITVILEGA